MHALMRHLLNKITQLELHKWCNIEYIIETKNDDVEAACLCVGTRLNNFEDVFSHLRLQNVENFIALRLKVGPK